MRLDYHVHVVAHGEYEYREEWLNQYLRTARQRGIQSLGLVEHDEYADRIDAEVIQASRQHGIYIASGLEVDYFVGREGTIKQLIDQGSYDFVIGSVHSINGWAFDHPDYRDRFSRVDIDQIYQQYFDLVASLVHSRCCDIVGHLDLIKKWGHHPRRKTVLEYAEPILKSIKASGMVIEINSAGWRKPVMDLYPSLPIIRRMYELGLPVTMGSDAHHPSEVGEDLDRVSRLLWEIGYRRVVSFRNRRATAIALQL